MSLVKRIVHRSSFTRGPEGRAYYRRGAVHIDQLGMGLLASVRGSRPTPYTVRMRWPDSPASARLRAACTCPNFRDGFTCKHIWAALYAVDARRVDLVPGRSALRLERDPGLLRLGSSHPADAAPAAGGRASNDAKGAAAPDVADSPRSAAPAAGAARRTGAVAPGGDRSTGGRHPG